MKYKLRCARFPAVSFKQEFVRWAMRVYHIQFE